MLQALAKEFFDARLNDEGLLQSLNTSAPKSLCAANYPPRLDPKTLPFYVLPRDPGAPLLAPQPVKPVEPKVKTSRPGWSGGWT